MGDKAEVKQVNRVAEDENWRAAIRQEIAQAESFSKNWGYLAANKEDIESRNFETRKVKYFSGAAGAWTVVDKRIPITDEEAEEAKKHAETLGGTGTLGSAEFNTANFTKKQFGQLQTTNNQYGGFRKPTLELFGASQHGLKGSISKTPTIY